MADSEAMTTTPTLIHRDDCTLAHVVKVSAGGAGYLGGSYYKCLTCEAHNALPEPSGVKHYDERARYEQEQYERAGSPGHYYGSSAY